jgi:hypothetical protein
MSNAAVKMNRVFMANLSSKNRTFEKMVSGPSDSYFGMQNPSDAGVKKFLDAPLSRRTNNPSTLSRLGSCCLVEIARRAPIRKKTGQHIGLPPRLRFDGRDCD